MFGLSSSFLRVSIPGFPLDFVTCPARTLFHPSFGKTLDEFRNMCYLSEKNVVLALYKTGMLLRIWVNYR